MRNIFAKSIAAAALAAIASTAVMAQTAPSQTKAAEPQVGLLKMRQSTPFVLAARTGVVFVKQAGQQCTMHDGDTVTFVAAVADTKPPQVIVTRNRHLRAAAPSPSTCRAGSNIFMDKSVFDEAVKAKLETDAVARAQKQKRT